MSTVLHFNEKKATQAASLLLKLRGGKMSYMKLIKLLYLADREALIRYGRPISTDRYVSMDNGPVLSRVYNLAAGGNAPDSPSIWSSEISAPSNYEVSLVGKAECDELSDAEIELLKETFKKYGSMDRWDLVEVTHKLPEWQDPDGSAIPITYRDILVADGKKSELEITSIEDELAELAQAGALFGEH